MAALTIEQKRAVALASARARASESSGIPEGREGTRYDFLPPTSMVRQAGNMFDVYRDVLSTSANKPAAQPYHAIVDPFLDIISGVKRGTEDLTQGVPKLVEKVTGGALFPGAGAYKDQKEAQYKNVTQNGQTFLQRPAAGTARFATQVGVGYGGTGGLAKKSADELPNNVRHKLGVLKLVKDGQAVSAIGFRANETSFMVFKDKE
jgi:hypothetical protein